MRQRLAEIENLWVWVLVGLSPVWCLFWLIYGDQYGIAMFGIPLVVGVLYFAHS